MIIPELEKIIKENQNLFLFNKNSLFSQLVKTSEECAEVTQSICKYLLNDSNENIDNMCSEIADAYIMIYQMAIKFPKIKDCIITNLNEYSKLMDVS